MGFSPSPCGRGDDAAITLSGLPYCSPFEPATAVNEHAEGFLAHCPVKAE
jgi:hypothetical protein